MAYMPSPWQKSMHARAEPRKWIWVGRRGGKGRAVLHEALPVINTASFSPFIHDGLDMTDSLTPQIHVWCVAPNYGQAQQVWNEMKAFIPAHMVKPPQNLRGNRSSTGWNEASMNVWLDLPLIDGAGNTRSRTQVFWEIKSADNFEMLQTVGLDFLWMTESQDIKQGAWDKGRPILSSPGRLGRACIEGIPPLNRAHWFSRGYNDAIRRPTTMDTAITATTFDNIYLTEDQKDDIRNEKRKTTEAMWNRMYMAIQPDSGGAFFSASAIDAAKISNELTYPEPAHKYIAGLDLGKQTDPTVLIIKDRETRESVFAIEMLHRDWVVQKSTIAFETERWGCERIMMDSTGMGGDVLFDEFLDMGLPVEAFKFTNPSKHQLFLELAVALEQRTTSFPASWENLIEQMEGFEVTSQGTMFRYRQVNNGHDDWLDAEALALRACDPAREVQEARLRVHGKAGAVGINGNKKKQSAMMRQVSDWRQDSVLNERQPPPDIVINGDPVVMGQSIEEYR